MEDTKYTHRYLARLIIEAATPLSIGLGENSILTDSLVALDVNGLPYIPGTSITGVIRSLIGEKLKKEEIQNLFGYQSPNNSKEGQGSEIIFSDAKMIGKEGKVIDGLEDINFSDEFYKHFSELPIRQHVRISHRGVAQNGGKFDEQIIFKGTRFCFEIEMLCDGSNAKKEIFKSILSLFYNRSFRIGGGSRCGFGKIEVISVASILLNLKESEDLTSYLDKSSGLSQCASWWNDQKNVKEIQKPSPENDDYDEYKLRLRPDNFFLFGSGMGDSDADITPVKATYIIWNNACPHFETNAVLIPASSVKGALAHRTAFYYNQLTGKFANKENDIESLTGTNNEAVKALFGYAKRENGVYTQTPGNILISDVIASHTYIDKQLNHVSIDRFTCGAIKGALFAEKAIYDQETDKQYYEIEILVKKKSYGPNESLILGALQKALLDICNGMLPLGGGVNRGNGCFNGSLFINDNECK